MFVLVARSSLPLSVAFSTERYRYGSSTSIVCHHVLIIIEFNQPQPPIAMPFKVSSSDGTFPLLIVGRSLVVVHWSRIIRWSFVFCCSRSQSLGLWLVIMNSAMNSAMDSAMDSAANSGQ